MSDPLLDGARRWVHDDPDPQTRSEGQAIIDSGDRDAIRSHFGTRLSFGTAGMRGPLGPGPNRMNRATVIRVTAAVGEYAGDVVANARTRGIVIGFDGRHGSRQFARDAVTVLATAGYRVYAFEDVVPTPRLAHALTHLGAAAGIMVTASHNPPEDNGYKVFWADGAQIVPPHDSGISAKLDEISATADIPRDSEFSTPNSGRVDAVSDTTHEQYFREVAALRVYGGDARIRIVYSAMHGVGRPSVERVLTSHGYHDLHLVLEQAEPDPDFSTVSFPNPEEPGAMDLSLRLAAEVGADLVLANDPDADRLCVGVATGADIRMLSGNEVGVLLANELLTHGDFGDDPLVVTTIVSTSMLAKVARAHGAKYRETLTGFKWLAQAGLEHEGAGGRFVMGFEEALGYSVGSVVRDKDGVSAALLFADLAARCRSEGRTVVDRLESLQRQHGLHLTAQESFRFPGESGGVKMAAIMDGLRQAPPKAFGPITVAIQKDYQSGVSVNRVTGDASTFDMPRSNVLAFHLGNGSRLMVRPSGTEPKIKFYFEICEAVLDGESMQETTVRARSALNEFKRVVISTMALETA